MRLLSILLLVLIGSLCGCNLNQTPSIYDYTAQYKKDTAAISAYLKTNNIAATELSQGIWYIIDTAATGIRATYYDTLYTKYKMRLLSNNKVIDQSTSPFFARLYNLLPGIQLAMPQFPKGSSGRIFIPSYFAYQNQSTPTIPANSNLIFEFTLTDVRDHQLRKDTAAIGQYVRSNGITPIVDPSGLRYTIDQVGSGIKPLISDSVVVTFGSQFMVSEGVVDLLGTRKIKVTDWLPGPSIGILNIPEGSKTTMYVPSSLGYGPVGIYNNGTYVPGNSIIAYNITLVKVIHH